MQTDTLVEPPMLSPHESLNLNPERGLLAAVSGHPSTYPGVVSIYDVSKDCRHPVLQSTRPVARIGHESGFAPDGKTFYAAGTAFEAITAVDVTDPKEPHALWQGNVTSHGMTLSDDGTRAYIADPGGELLILDVGEIQRRPDRRGLLVHHLRAAGVRHRRPPASEGDRLLRGAHPAAVRERVHGERLRDVAAGDRAPRAGRSGTRTARPASTSSASPRRSGPARQRPAGRARRRPRAGPACRGARRSGAAGSAASGWA